MPELSEMIELLDLEMEKARGVIEIHEDPETDPDEYQGLSRDAWESLRRLATVKAFLSREEPGRVASIFDPPADPLDDEGYPKEAALQAIRLWPVRNWQAACELLSYVEASWENGYGSVRVEDSGNGKRVELATDGWSGHEQVVDALMANSVFGKAYWMSSSRGGKHVFLMR